MIVFTPLHGTGSTTVLPVLRKAGFSVEMEPSQSTFDGAFPAVPYVITSYSIHYTKLYDSSSNSSRGIGSSACASASRWRIPCE